MLDRIRIVLVNTSHPGNIGSAARAMKTMGLHELYLVSPELFPHPKANEMASGATDVLEKAIVTASLDDAIADCTLVVGTSARARTIPWPLLTPREMAEKIKHEAAGSQIAIVFGREQSGLSNEELQRCHLHIQIPANPEYSSLNLAAAVQIVAYEVRMATGLHETAFEESWDYRLATADEMEKFFDHLQTVLIEIDFLKMNAPRKLMTRLRRLFLRTRPDIMEMNMLRGILTAIQESRKK
ncbi:tRNA (cytosine(32)/uridine(32)-2'-O)-methyltransferase TrmJ [Aquicella lusitana]|uniref:tRNA (cytidine/uridine-2'-O-)-methyltransferase TrmJ n=1 Tax=Aquicella lusitana TaxID=254246 RepID=A0A370GT76_9COXI|nr:tRNA (cytosine(32)/uridine(32)-2'-O)-methyltransferase TrmJ [Aquicella lusitana]RDI46897.1 tRNA (cytidine32/uridine32-2'-O)-methyltransferase [Aquicella lusitana]VVC73788.1 tRNA (cytidine/uridine-2'-O-)-methyltransferase TrmJ [Aquicella lusitana]